MAPRGPTSGPTERLWIVEPKRKTCLAEVTGVSRDRFRLDAAELYVAPPRPAGWNAPTRSWPRTSPSVGSTCHVSTLSASLSRHGPSRDPLSLLAKA